MEDGKKESGSPFTEKPQPGKAVVAAPEKKVEPANPGPSVQVLNQGEVPIPGPGNVAAAGGSEEMIVAAAGVRASDIDVDTETKLLEVVRKRQSNKKELIDIALKQTTEEDWVFQGTKPYLEVTGAEIIAPIFSVRIVNVVYKREEGQLDDGTKFVRHWYFGEAQIAPNGIVLYKLEGLFGCTWTRDEFFAKKKDGSFKRWDEVDERDLRYKAYSDLMRVAVVRLLGLRSISVDQLIKAGLKVDKIQGVSRGVEVSDDDKTKQDELLQIVKNMVGTDEAKVRAKVKELTIFTKEGKEIFKDNATQLTGKWLDKTLSKAKAEAEKIDRENGGGR